MVKKSQMKKWYNWQLENQVQNNNWPSVVKPVANLASELAWFVDSIDQGYNNKTLNYYFDNVFYRSDWLTKASNSTDGNVTAEQLCNWMHDPEYATLMDNQGVEYIVDFDQYTLDQLKNILSNGLNLIKDSINLRVHIQRPGQFFALHFDRNKYKQFNVNNPSECYETQSQIFLIFLSDRSIGQSFHLGPAQLDWQQGDTFTWQQVDVPHGSANCGLDTRYSLILTGNSRVT
jgi:hypothetical protein